MTKATVNGIDVGVYDFKRDEQGRLWCYVKCEYYSRPLPVYAGFIEVVNEGKASHDEI